VIPNISVKPGLVGQVCNPALRRQKGMDRIHGQRELYRRSCLKETNTQERANHALIFQKCISWELSLNPESREVDVLKTGLVLVKL
jgi:hypothetical protein